eukprot:scaffold50084_cov67-Cyclotella_meneghiniana.AAC.1
MKYEPHAHNKTADPYNIDYVIGTDVSSDNVFRGNVMFDLRIRHYSSADVQVSMLRKCLVTGVEVRRCRDAVLLYEKAIKDRLLDPAICVPCVLHACNRMAEKVLFMIFQEAFASARNSADNDFVSEIQLVINRDVLGQSQMHLNDRSGYKIPFEDGKSDLEIGQT